MFLNTCLNVIQYVIAVLALIFLVLKIKELTIKAVKAELRACNISMSNPKEK